MTNTKCLNCGQSDEWCAVYTSCPLAKGNAHRMGPDYPRCIVVKRNGREIQHQHVWVWDFSGRHCCKCQIEEIKI